MRRSAIHALATVSLAALVGVASSSQAVTVASLGTLKQLDQWKVGIVDPQGQSFCAMVGKFDKNMGLAFALSPDGYGSVAVDMAEGKFIPGETYKLGLKTGGKKSTFAGRATSDRSIVVQIGQNKAFYDTLKSGGAFGVSLPSTSADFTLSNFSKSYVDLVECSKTLTTPAAGGPAQMPAVKVKEVVTAALGPAGKDVKTVKEDTKNVQVASAAPVKKAEEAPAAAVPTIIWGETPKPERKVLASTRSVPVVPKAEDTGSAARQWDISSDEAAQKAELLKLAEQEKQARIATLEAVKREAAKQHVAAFNAQKDVIDTKVAALQKQTASIESAKPVAGKDKALKASIVAKQAEILRLESERVRQTQDLTKKLAATQGEFNTKVSAIEAERDQLKQQLAAAQSAQQLAASRVSLLQSQLDVARAKGTQAAQDQKQMAELQARLQQAESTRKALEASLAASQKDAAAAQAIRTEMAQLQSRLAASENDKHVLEVRLAGIEQQSKLVNETLAAKEKARSHDAESYKVEAAKLLSGYQKTVDELQGQMKQQGDQYALLQQRHETLKQQARTLELQNAKLAAEESKAKSARKSLVVIDHDELPASLIQSKEDTAALASAESRIAELERELESSRIRTTALQNSMAAKVSYSAAEKEQALNDMRGKLEKAQAEIDSLKGANKSLSAKLVTPSPEQTAALGALKGKLASAEAELQRLKTQNADLASKAVAVAKTNVKTDATKTKRPSLVVLNDGAADARPFERIRQLEQKVAELESTPKAPATKVVFSLPTAATDIPATDVVDDLSPILSAPPVAATAPVPARKPLQQQALQDIRKLQAIEPAAGISSVPQVQTPPARRFAVATSAPAKPVVAPVVKKDPSFDGNRAAAFLDRILAYHRNGDEDTEPAPAINTKERVFAAHQTPAFAPLAGGMEPIVAQQPVVARQQPVVTRQQASSALRGYAAAPVAAAPVRTPVAKPVVVERHVVSMATPKSEPVLNSQPEWQRPIVAAAPVVQQPVRKQAAASALSVEQILASAGINDAIFQPAQQDEAGIIVRQWTVGGLSGMYEQMPVTASFSENKQAYLARYREDCPSLTVQNGSTGRTETGVYEVASITCPSQGNAYSTSFVFWQDGKKFSAVLHSGYTSDAPQVRSLADNIGHVLSGAGGLLSPQVVGQAETAVSAGLGDVPAPQLRFNIPQQAAVVPSYGAKRADGLETVIIE